MWHLYVIIDKDASGKRELAWVARQAIQGGADVIQLRDKKASTSDLIKEAKDLLKITRRAKIPLIINDRVDVAYAVGADGVHLGQDDLPVSVARRILGSRRIIGKSTHSLAQAKKADREPVDYFALGPVFSTPTKPDYTSVGLRLVGQVSHIARHPFVAIGGIDESVLTQVISNGAKCVAVVRAVCAADSPKEACRRLKKVIFASYKISNK